MSKFRNVYGSIYIDWFEYLGGGGSSNRAPLVETGHILCETLLILMFYKLEYLLFPHYYYSVQRSLLQS